MSKMICKKVYVEESELERIDAILKETNQSFSGYVRELLQDRTNDTVELPNNFLQYHAESMGELTNIVRFYLQRKSHKHGYLDFLDELLELEFRLEELIEDEKLLVEHVLKNSKGTT